MSLNKSHLKELKIFEQFSDARRNKIYCQLSYLKESKYYEQYSDARRNKIYCQLSYLY